MNDMERNRQIVQDGLDKRASKRKKAIMDAEHEAITIHMFQIINTNAHDAEERRRAEYENNELNVRKAIKKKNRQISMLKRHRNVYIINAIASFLTLVVAIIFFLVGLTELVNMIVVSSMSAITLAFNLCVFVTTQKKLNRRA